MNAILFDSSTGSRLVFADTSEHNVLVEFYQGAAKLTELNISPDQAQKLYDHHINTGHEKIQ